MIVAIIFIALLAAAAIALVTFLGATAVGTVVGIIAAIHQGRAARRAAAAAGTPYRRITYKQAREERLARQAAEGGAPRHMAPRPGPLRTDAAGRRQAAAAAETPAPGIEQKLMTAQDWEATAFVLDKKAAELRIAGQQQAADAARPGYWTTAPAQPDHAPRQDPQA